MGYDGFTKMAAGGCAGWLIWVNYAICMVVIQATNAEQAKKTITADRRDTISSREFFALTVVFLSP